MAFRTLAFRTRDHDRSSVSKFGLGERAMVVGLLGQRLRNSVAQADSSSELSWQVPGDDVGNWGPAPSQGASRPAGPTSHKENTMAKYLLLKHYRRAPAPVNNVPMDQWRPDEDQAHIRFI